MDALTQSGQALVLAVVLLGFGAATITGLRAAQERLFDQARQDRAAEAAIEAAGAVVADHLARRGSAAAVVGDSAVRDAARRAAGAAAIANDSAAALDLRISHDGRGILVEGAGPGRRQRVLVPWR